MIAQILQSQNRAISLWIIVALLVGLWGWIQLGSAESVDAVATAHMDTVLHQVQRLQTLRARTQLVGHGRRPDGDLITRVQKALAQAGLPLSACSGVQPHANQVVGSTGMRVQTVQVTLHSLRPDELGNWMSAWSARDQPWSISQLQLAHAPGAPTAGAGSTSLDSNRFDVSILLSAPYVEESP